MPFGLPPDTITLICRLLARYPQIEQVKIYGSRAVGTYEPGSDIDLAVYAPTGDSLLVAHLLAALDELPTPYLFDVTDYYRLAHLPLKENIDRDGQTLYLAGGQSDEL
jgi:predicted nucleotidyltransferase